MPEDREMPEYCPVRNGETYLQKLHPQCNRLWKFPKDSYNIFDECWLKKKPIGKDTLASFMSTLSKKNRPFTKLHQPLNSCNGCNYPRKKLFNGTNGVHLSRSRQVAHVYYQLFDSKMADGDQLGVSAEARI